MIRGLAAGGLGTYFVVKNKPNTMWYNKRPFQYAVPAGIFFIASFSFYRAFTLNSNDSEKFSKM